MPGASPHFAVLATSLDPESRSQVLASLAVEAAKHRKIPISHVDLRTFQLPFCGTSEGWGDREVTRLRQLLLPATHIIFSSAVYNYDLNAAAKNVVELMGDDVFGGKTVGFICCAGARSSYMSVMAFANSLMLDFRCWIVPRFVYAIGDDFADGALRNQDVVERIDTLIAEALAGPAASRQAET